MDLLQINIDTQSLKTHSAIIQSSKNEKVVLIDLIEGGYQAVLCETVSFTLSRQ
jgi:hypothetical protein